MAKTKINCLNCNIEKFVENKEIKRGFGKFCSRKCASAFNRNNLEPPTPNVKCAYCQIDFYITPSRAARSKSRLYFCCAEHHDFAQRLDGIKEILPAHYGTGAPENTYRRKIFTIRPKTCERCGYNKHEAAIIVHHKDRNRKNDNIDNLEVLCANCHLEEHYGESDI